jgi:hypothetical protein
MSSYCAAVIGGRNNNFSGIDVNALGRRLEFRYEENSYVILARSMLRAHLDGLCNENNDI